MILIRHGQSHFNLHFGANRIDPGIVDPGLTDEGSRQIAAAAEGLRGTDLRRIISSPYTRTLESAAILAEALGLEVTIEPLVRERSYFTCDIGSTRGDLTRRWPALDFSHLEERWWHEPEEPEPVMQERCRSFAALAGGFEDWPHVLVVSHWAFIKGLTGEGLENAQSLRFEPFTA